MIVGKSSVPELLEMETLHEVLRSAGPCVTVLLPPFHRGEPAQPGTALLHTYLQEAAKQLPKLGLRKTEGESLLEPLEHLANDPAWLTGSHFGCAIFRSPDDFCQFRLTGPAVPSLTIAGCFAIRRLLPDFRTPGLFYILGLSKESVRLLRCVDYQVQAVELPDRTPRTLEEAMALDAPDHVLENRSAAGPSAGARRRIRFGTGTGHETEQRHLTDFYKMVDRGLQKLLREPGIPVLLAGVEENIAIYRAASTYGSLVKEHLNGSPSLPTPETETMAHAISVLRAEELRREARALKEAMEHTAPGRFSTDPRVIVHAAFEGRVDELYLDNSAECRDVFERRTYRSWGEEDLLNLAAVETMLHRGKAFELPRGMMVKGAMAVAFLRY